MSVKFGTKKADVLVGHLKEMNEIWGHSGDDTLAGGEGKDTFVYFTKDTAGAAVDTITDFKAGTDKLDLSDFAKGSSYADSVRFINGGSDTKVQGFVDKKWVDIVVLTDIDATKAGFEIRS